MPTESLGKECDILLQHLRLGIFRTLLAGYFTHLQVEPNNALDYILTLRFYFTIVLATFLRNTFNLITDCHVLMIFIPFRSALTLIDQSILLSKRLLLILPYSLQSDHLKHDLFPEIIEPLELTRDKAKALT